MAGWKSWQNGEVVLASEFQDYIQNQVVQQYADSTARADAVSADVVEGMVSYLDNTNTLQFWDGSSWISIVSASGTGVVTNAMLAGSIANDKLVNSGFTLNGTAVPLGGSAVITGGGGTADFNNPMTTLGDLIVGGTAGVAERLGIGTAGQYLFTNGTVSSWAALGTATTISGNIAPTQITAGTFTAGAFAFGTAVTTGNTVTTDNAMRNITMSTATPTGGADGDVWLQYTP
jgi:hypothetical protein